MQPVVPASNAPCDQLARLQSLHPLLGLGGKAVLKTGRRPASRRLLTEAAQPGRIVDCLATPGGGAALAAWWMCTRVCGERGQLVVVDLPGGFYPPAAMAWASHWGLDARRLLMVAPANAKQALSAIEQSLRSPAVSAVWAMPGRVDARAFRRLLLAAEAGQTLGVVVRRATRVAGECCADTQFLFRPTGVGNDPREPLYAVAQNTRNRHGPAEGTQLVKMDWRTGELEEQSPEDEVLKGDSSNPGSAGERIATPLQG